MLYHITLVSTIISLLNYIDNDYPTCCLFTFHLGQIDVYISHKSAPTMHTFVNVFCYHRTSLRMNSGFEWDIISTSIISGQPDSAINSIRNRFCNTNNTNLRIASCNIPKKTFKKTETVSETNTTCQLRVVSMSLQTQRPTTFNRTQPTTHHHLRNIIASSWAAVLWRWPLRRLQTSNLPTTVRDAQEKMAWFWAKMWEDEWRKTMSEDVVSVKISS